MHEILSFITEDDAPVSTSFIMHIGSERDIPMVFKFNIYKRTFFIFLHPGSNTLQSSCCTATGLLGEHR